MTTGERADGGNPTACAPKSMCPARCQCETGEQHEEEASISCERAGLMSVPHDVPCDVRSMFLRGNALRMLPPGALPPLLFLRRLSLAHNNLTFIAPDAFQGVPALLWLSLSHNNDLGILHARALSGLQVLQTLILAACRLHDLPQRLFAPTHGLTHLHLWDNRLRRIPGALRILSRLTHLYLEDNAIEVVASSSLLGLENLTLLDLQDNYISVIHEEAFISCNKLTSLNLANNHLSSLPANAFHGLNQLQVLNLGGNQLLEVPQACLFGLASLHTLHLEHNRVKEFPPAVYDALPLLHTLHLQGNWLSSLSPPNSITATALRTLYLFDNPWHCDCNLFWLLQSATAHSQHPPYGAAARDVRCTSPEVVVGFLLPLLDFSGCFNTHANFTNIHKEPPHPISPARTLMPGHDVFTGMVQRLLLERAKSVPEPNTNAPPNSVIRQSTHFGSIVLMVVVIWRF